MDEINPKCTRRRRVVIGRTTSQPGRRKNDPNSPIAGMPIIEVSQGKRVIVNQALAFRPGSPASTTTSSTNRTPQCSSPTRKRRREVAAEIEQL